MAFPYSSETPRRRIATSELQIATLIDTLSRSVRFLTVDIEHEEALASCKDPMNPCYPVLARNLRARRDNLAATVASLEHLLQDRARAA